MGKPRKKGPLVGRATAGVHRLPAVLGGPRQPPRIRLYYFGVSVPQASSDLTLYQEQARGQRLIR